jgi:hypothetical protein
MQRESSRFEHFIRWEKTPTHTHRPSEPIGRFSGSILPKLLISEGDEGRTIQSRLQPRFDSHFDRWEKSLPSFFFSAANTTCELRKRLYQASRANIAAPKDTAAKCANWGLLRIKATVQNRTHEK